MKNLLSKFNRDPGLRGKQVPGLFALYWLCPLWPNYKKK